MKVMYIILICFLSLSFTGCNNFKDNEDITAVDSLALQSEGTTELVEVEDFSNLSVLPISLGVTLDSYSYTVTESIVDNGNTVKYSLNTFAVDKQNKLSELDCNMMIDSNILGSRKYFDLESHKLYTCNANTDDILSVAHFNYSDLQAIYPIDFSGVVNDNWVLYGVYNNLLHYSCDSSQLSASYLSQGENNSFDNIEYSSYITISQDDYNIISYQYIVEGDMLTSDGTTTHRVVTYDLHENGSCSLSLPDGFKDLEVGGM